MLGKEAFHITSFQESYGYKGVKGLDAKVNLLVRSRTSNADVSLRLLSQIRLVLITFLSAKFLSMVTI